MTRVNEVSLAYPSYIIRKQVARLVSECIFIHDIFCATILD